MGIWTPRSSNVSGKVCPAEVGRRTAPCQELATSDPHSAQTQQQAGTQLQEDVDPMLPA